MNIDQRVLGGSGLIFIAFVVVLGLAFVGGNEDKVPNCWDKSQDCNYVELDQTHVSCNDWYISHPEEDLECEWTEEGVDDIALVTDPGNHVQGPVTEIEYEVEKYDNGLNGQQDLEFLPDGRMLVGDQNGIVYIGENEDFDTRFDLDDIVDGKDLMGDFNTGVHGLAVGPDYDENNRIFIYYSMNNASEAGYEVEVDHSYWHHRVGSFTLKDDSLEHNENMVDVEGAVWHTGGGVEIGPDNKLYVTIGDADEQHWSQDLDSHRGKTLRINFDGTVPEDNPFDDSYIYTLGHRNHQGISWDPKTGKAWSAEHGEARNDEINVIEAGENYGWGADYSCGEVYIDSAINVESVKEPVRCYDTWTHAPSRTEFVDDEMHPWYGDMFVAGLRGKHLRRYDVDGETIEEEELFYFNEEAPDRTGVGRRLRDVEFHDGSLWLLGDIGRYEPAAGIIEIQAIN